MGKERIRILVVGDELGLGEPLVKAFEADGHLVKHSSRPSDAMEFYESEKFDYVFVDCMLQGSSNGVDFILKAKSSKRTSAQFILMSGIFTDKAFIKESLESTKAVAFVEKTVPFDVSRVTKLVAKPDAETEVHAARKKLYQMFGQGTVSNREKRKLIESLEEVSGYDLAFIYSLLIETGSSGYLNIYNQDGSVSGVSISKGEIVGVDVVDQATYLGEMLIQSGYALPEDITRALEERTDQKLGMRLIKNNQLSPHAFDLILTEQMNIRLSRMITDQTIRINFAAAEVEKVGPGIDAEMLRSYLHDWIASKLPMSWLKSLYLIWGGHGFEFSSSFMSNDPTLDTDLVKALPGIVGKIKAGTTLNQLLMSKEYPELNLYKGVHFLLTRGLIVFGHKSGFKDVAEQLASLKSLAKDLEGKNPLEIANLIGVENMTGPALKELLGAEPPQENAACLLLWNELKRKLETAAHNAQDAEARNKFKEDAAEREAELKLHATQKIEEAKKVLGFNQYAKALELLGEAQKANPSAGQLHILTSWAKIGLIDPKKRVAQLKEIEFEIMQIPAEEKYDAHYPFVLGIFSRAKGDIISAKKQLERSVAMNQGLLVARRELSALGTVQKKDKDIFNMDVKTLIGGMFKKK